MLGVAVQVVHNDYRFSDFFADRALCQGPGWYVFGRNAEKYGVMDEGKGRYVAICARPDVKLRWHRHYNVPVRRGWHTKREAQAVADAMNHGEMPYGYCHT